MCIPHTERKAIKNSHHGKGWKKAKGLPTTEKYTGVVGGCFMMFHCYVGLLKDNSSTVIGQKYSPSFHLKSYARLDLSSKMKGIIFQL